MVAADSSVDELLAVAIGHVNAGEPERAMQVCEQAVATLPPHPAVLQLFALLCLNRQELPRAAECAAASLALRPDHGPTVLIAGDVGRAAGNFVVALGHHRRAVELMPDRVDAVHALGVTLQRCGRAQEAETVLAHAVVLAPRHAPAWFSLALARQDLRDLAGAEAALRQVLTLAAPRAEVEVNLGIVLQEGGRLDEAMRAFGRAYRLQEGSFGRIAHALATPGVGRLWLRLDDLRATLLALPD